MREFFSEGGFAMFFLLAFGLATLGTATHYAFRVVRRAFRLTLALGVATLFATLTGVCVDLAAVGHGAPDYVKQHPGVALGEALLQGLAESLAPGVLGFTLLSLSALVTAVGLYREPGA